MRPKKENRPPPPLATESRWSSFSMLFGEKARCDRAVSLAVVVLGYFLHDEIASARRESNLGIVDFRPPPPLATKTGSSSFFML